MVTTCLNGIHSHGPSFTFHAPLILLLEVDTFENHWFNYVIWWAWTNKMLVMPIDDALCLVGHAFDYIAGPYMHLSQWGFDMELLNNGFVVIREKYFCCNRQENNGSLELVQNPLVFHGLQTDCWLYTSV